MHRSAQAVPYCLDHGVDLFGGRGTIWGAIAGALVLAMIGNVLNLLGVVAYWQWIVQGLILLLAVGLYAIDFGRARDAQLA